MMSLCWTIGDNEMGQQGVGSNEDEIEELELITDLKHMSITTIKNIICGAYGSTYILCDKNRMIVMGNDEYGQLGVIYSLIQTVIIAWARHHAVIPFDILTLMVSFVPHSDLVKDSYNKPFLINDFPIKYISNGISSRHRFIITATDEIYAAGDNSTHQCGIDYIRGYDSEHSNFNTWTKVNYFKQNRLKVKSIASAFKYSAFLTYSGEIYCCGSGNSYWQRTLSFCRINIDEIVTEIVSGDNESLALTEHGNVYRFTTNTNATKITYFESNSIHIAQIASGAEFNVALDNNNKLYCWGFNVCGQCGNGNVKYVSEPQLNVKLLCIQIVDIKCGACHSIAKSISDEYYLWGSNDFNQCLVDDELEYITKPRKFKDTFFTEKNQNIIAMYPGFNETRIVTKVIVCTK